ncbi:DNA cytosine methyltransferase [Erwinia sp. OPT-41]|uniref:DNA (cytosine-5-)-methyltransferase n=1 Tax=Erwinia plantamica TaxID=3237104 RepID=A0ABW7CL68_9GAMM
MRYGSVCSGIEAATAAWHSLGWQPAWFSEIEKFPSAVLAHHWPHVQNLGDMTRLAARILAGEIEAPDLLVGGTPCQAFSVAGLRNGLADARGQLTLAFVELVNAIDEKRRECGKPPAIIVWENVPGVLTSKDNAFGCFIAGLAGESSPLDVAGGKWTHAGYVTGPERAVAWRTLDAQFFRVAQRRRRVFVIASARDDLDPAKIFFEPESLRRNTPPRRKTGTPVAPLTAAGAGVGGPDFAHAAAGHLISAYGGGNCSGPLDVAACLNTRGQRQDFDVETFAVQHVCPLLEVGKRTGLSTTDKRAGTGIGLNGDPMFTLQAGAQHGIVAFGENGRGEVRFQNNDGQITGPLSTGGGKPGQGYPAICVSLPGRDGGTTAELGGEVANSLRAAGGGKDKAHVLVSDFRAFDIHGTLASEVAKETPAHTPLRARKPGQFENSTVTMLANRFAVRRLTPRECERLQGFPDDHTKIPWRKKTAEHCPDGPRYRAIGNSMAVPVMRWLGERIARSLADA